MNALLPFASAWGKPELAGQAVALYRSYPVLASNTVADYMKQKLGLARGLVNTARRQQGLLHVYKKCCFQGECGQCSLLTQPQDAPALYFNELTGIKHA